jgi:O-antigen/teichoic acid export membrane protein
VPLLTKTLGALNYGIWAQVYVTISLIAPFTNLGLGGAMVRFLAAEKSREEIQEGFYSVISVLFMINLIAALIIIALAYPLANNFFDGAVQIVRITSILVLLTPISTTYLLLIRTFQQIKRYSVFIIAEDSGRLALIAYLVLNGHGILSVVLSVVAVKFILLLVLFFLIKSQIGIKRPRFSRLKEYLSFGLPLVPRGIAFWLVNLSDRYVIGFFLGATSVGIYSAATGLGSLPYSVMAVLTFVLLATLPYLYDKGRRSEVAAHLTYSLKYFLAITIPFIFGATILAEPVLRMFTTPQIASQGHFIVPLIALAVSFLSIHNIISHILMFTKKTKVMAPIWLVAAGLNIGLNILVVPRIGILGAAITTLIAYSLALALVTYYSLKEFKFRIDWRFIIKSLVASAVMSVVVWLMAPQGNLDTLLTVVIGVIIYGVVLLLLRGFSKEEMRFFRGLLRRSPTPPYSNNGE